MTSYPLPAPAYPLPPPAGAIPLSRTRYLTSCLGEALKAAARLAGRRSRTPSASLAEYGQRWARTAERLRQPDGALRQPDGTGPPDVDRAVELSSYGTAPLCALVDRVPYEVGAPAFFHWRADKLAAVFRAHYPRSTPITEIGCGVGKNLLVLARAGYQQLAGYDPVDAAVLAVAAQAERFGLEIETGRFDLLDPDSGVLRRLHGRVLFTNHVLEQLPRHLPVALDCLLRAAPREVIHIEPCAEPLRPWRSATDLVTWLHTHACDYQRTLMRELTALHTAGRIELLEVTALGYAPRPRSTPTLIRWRPGRS